MIDQSLGKLRGMNESSLSVDIPPSQTSRRDVCSRVVEAAWVTPVENLEGENLYGFSGKTISSGTPVLITVKVAPSGNKSLVTVNCEKMAISSMLGKEIVTALL